jgi:hypothetical protein
MPDGAGDRQQLLADLGHGDLTSSYRAKGRADGVVRLQRAEPAPVELLPDGRLGRAEQHRGTRPAGRLTRHGGEHGERGRVRRVHPGQIQQQRVGLLGQAFQQGGSQPRGAVQHQVTVHRDDDVPGRVVDGPAQRQVHRGTPFSARLVGHLTGCPAIRGSKPPRSRYRPPSR